MTSLHLSTFLFVSCQTEPQVPVNKDMVLTTPKHVASKDGDFEKMSFQCCDSEPGNQLLTQYLTLSKAMANDDDAATQKAVKAMLPITTDPTFAKEASLSELILAIPRWQDQDRKTIQQDFSDASLAMIKYAKQHKATKGTTIIVGYCPMAPGRWLQTEKVISNPYYGSDMLTCGVFEE